MVTMGGDAVNKLLLMVPNNRDHVDSTQGLVKLQHKLQQMVQREDAMVGKGYGGTRRSRMQLPHSC